MNDAVLPVIVPLCVAVVTYILAPPIVARIKGTADKQLQKHESELKQLDEWRKAREIEHTTLQAKYETLQQECQGLRDEVRDLKQREAGYVKELHELRVGNELMEHQITSLRNDNYRLMQKMSSIERGTA